MNGYAGNLINSKAPFLHLVSPDPGPMSEARRKGGRSDNLAWSLLFDAAIRGGLRCGGNVKAPR